MAPNNNLKLNLLNIVAFVVLIVLIGLGGIALGNWNKKRAPGEKSIASVQTVSYQGEEGKTVLELLKSKAEIEVQESSLGVLVTSINGVKNSQDQFWLFYVNDELAPSGADQYITQDTDKIEWRYESFEF